MAEQSNVERRRAGPDLSETMQPHTKRVLMQERIAKGVLWFAAGLTVTVLALIVGYIVVNGFYTRTLTVDEVLPVVSEAVGTGFPNADSAETIRSDMSPPGPTFSVVAPRGLRLKDVTYRELRDIFAGLQTYLGYMTEQNVTATPVVYDRGRFREYVLDYLMLGGLYETAPADQIQWAATEEEIQNLLNSNLGTVAVVPTDMVDRLSRVRIVGVREVAIVTHPGVLALQRGRRLEVVTLEQVSELLTGAVSPWSAIGGPSIEVRPADPKEGDPGTYEPLPVTPVLLSPNTALGTYVVEAGGMASVLVPQDRRQSQEPESPPEEDATGTAVTVVVETAGEFARVLAGTPGAVGLIRAREAAAYGLSTLKVERVTHSANLRPAKFIKPPSRAGAVGGLSTIIINTIVMVLFVILITTPIGVAAAIYLVEYARQGKLLEVLRIGTATLHGVPSIIFGLFGMVFFAEFLGFQTGLLSGTLTLTLMILPTVVRTSEEALKAVPSSLREGSFALGATKVQTVFRVVLPAASPGIVTGMILGIGRAVGETAALLFTMGSNLALIRSLNSPIRVLSVHLYMLIRENISFANAFAAATILLIIVFAVNAATNRLIGRMNKV